MIHQKTWPLAGGAYFLYISIQKTLKIFLSETTGPMFSILLGRNVSGNPLPRLFMIAAKGRGFFKKKFLPDTVRPRASEIGI